MKKVFAVLAVFCLFTGQAVAGSCVRPCNLYCPKGMTCTVNNTIISTEDRDCFGLKGMVGGGNITICQKEDKEWKLRVAKVGSKIEKIISKADCEKDLMSPFAPIRIKLPGATPFDPPAASGKVSSGALIGLPFGDILPQKNPAYITDNRYSSGTLKVTLQNTKQSQSLKVTNGIVPLNTLRLEKESHYDYVYTSSAKKFVGSFHITSDKMKSNVELDIQLEHNGPSVNSAVQINALLSWKLRWDAFQHFMKRRAL